MNLNKRGDIIVHIKEALIKSQNTVSRHSGAGLNPVKSIVCWMLVFTSMTVNVLNQRFLN